MTKHAQRKDVPPTHNKSWRPGQKGQGGEGMSEGYGGSAGPGTGPSGPDTTKEHPEKPSTKSPAPGPSKGASPCLPSKETIEKVLR